MTAAAHPSLAAVLRYVLDVLPHTELGRADRAVAVMIAAHYNARHGAAWPSVRTLAAITGLHPSSVRRSTYAIVDAGVMAADLSPGQVTRYRFPLAGVVHTARVDARGQEGEHVFAARVDARDPARARARPRASTRAELSMNVLRTRAASSVAAPPWVAAGVSRDEWVRSVVRQADEA